MALVLLVKVLDRMNRERVRRWQWAHVDGLILG